MRYITEPALGEHLVDQAAHLLAFAAVNHAEQVVRPVRQSPRALVTEVHACGLAKFAADLIDLIIRNVHHQHGVGAKAHGAVLEHQAHAAKQSALAPAADLIKHRLLVGTDALGQHLIGPCGQWQAGFEQAPQLQCLQIVEE